MKRISLRAIALCAGLCCATAAAQAPEKRLANVPIKPVPADKLAEIVKAAPKVPIDLDLGMKLKLIDYIDCTNPADPHDFRDQGTSRVVSGPAGKYRLTAGHRHAFFSYAFKTAGRDRPVVLVVEYPDDAKRTIAYMTHDSMRPGRPHLSFSQEVGVYTGEPLPLTNKMQYATVYAWPQDAWSPIIVLNWTRFGGGGAASRIWVYEVQDMPPLKIDEPDPANPRTMDAFFCLGFLMTRDNFGWQSPDATRHMCRYMKHIGVNRITMMCYANQSWGAMCTVPAWDIADDKGYLDNVLKAMDDEGGVGFILGIVAEGMYGKVMAGGKHVAALAPEEFKRVMIAGFDQLIDRYGKYKSFKGFALGSMEALGFYDLLAAKGCAKEVVAHIKKRRGDLDVITYVGPWHLQAEYFDGKKGPDMWDVISRWEKSGQPWSDFLGDEALKYLKGIKNDPAAMKAVPGLQVYEKYTSEDHRVYELYRQQPRAMVYWDVDRSQRRSDHVATPYAGLFDQFDEGWIGLRPNVNFWYHKDWTAPTTSAGMPCTLMPYSRMLAHRDRLAVSAGTWTMKYFGAEPAIRRFAKAFRSLPPVEMTGQPIMPMREGTGPAQITDTVKVRWAVYKGKRYVYAVSRIPFTQQIILDGKRIDLRPYDVVTVSDDGKATPVLDIRDCPEYRKWLEARIAGFLRLCAEVKALNAEAVPQAYLDAAKAASHHVAAGHPYAADVALGQGLVNEIRLRKEILDPPTLTAPRTDKPPPMNGDLDAWPKAASDMKAEGGEHLAGHIFFPNSWHGPKDLSARLRLMHKGGELYVGLEVRDDVLDPKDGVAFQLSKSAYLNWRGSEAKADINWQVPAPVNKDKLVGKGKFEYVVHRKPGGYVIEGGADLSDLGFKPGEPIGFRVMLADVDKSANLKYTLRGGVTTWAKKQSFLIPHQQNFTYWSDARNCARLILGK